MPQQRPHLCLAWGMLDLEEQKHTSSSPAFGVAPPSYRVLQLVHIPLMIRVCMILVINRTRGMAQHQPAAARVPAMYVSTCARDWCHWWIQKEGPDSCRVSI